MKGRFISDIIAVDVENIEEGPVKAMIKPEDMELVAAKTQSRYSEDEKICRRQDILLSEVKEWTWVHIKE